MEVTRVYGTSTTIYFPLIDAGTADFESTPVTHASGDTQISIDGGAFSNTTNAFAHEGNGIYSLPLLVSETSGSIIVITIIDQTATKAWEDQCVIINTGLGSFIEGGQSIVICEIEDGTFTPTTTAFECFRIAPNATEETTADHYNGRLITFSSGVLLGQQRAISDYVLANSLEKFTVGTAFTDAPSDGDRFIIS